MLVRQFFFNLILNMLLFHLVARLFGVTLPTNAIYFFASLAIIAGAILLHKPIRNFLTLRSNLFIDAILVGLLVLGVLYLADLLVPGFSVEPLFVDGSKFEALILEDFVIGKYSLMFFIGVVMALVSALLDYLKC